MKPGSTPVSWLKRWNDSTVVSTSGSSLRLYTYRWLSLAVWLYVLEGLVRATSERGPGALCAWAEAVLGVALFTACAMHVRARLKAGHELGALTAEAARGA